MGNEDWANLRSPSRASQQPIRAVSPRIRRNTDNDDIVSKLNLVLTAFCYVPSCCFVGMFLFLSSSTLFQEMECYLFCS